jgi:hypothetical protein
MNIHVKRYLQKIGAMGGKKSRRVLTTEQSLEMTRIREEKRKTHSRKKGIR